MRCLLARPPRGIDKYTLPGGNQHTPLFYFPPLLHTTGGEDIETVQGGKTLLREPLLHDRVTPPLLVAAPKWPDHFAL